MLNVTKFGEELDRPDINPFELVNVAGQASRLINSQHLAEEKLADEKITTTALKSTFNGKIVKMENEDIEEDV